MSYNQWNGDIGLATLEPQSAFPELYQELWWYSGNSSGGSVATSASTGGSLQKGNTGLSASPVSLYTLSSNWNSNTQCAFEISLATQNNSNFAYAGLWDITSNTLVSGSQVSTSSTTINIVRSGTFTLTPSHQFGVRFWTLNSTYSSYGTDASLIIFPPASSRSSSLSSVSLTNPSGNMLKESYIPLYVYSTGYAAYYTYYIGHGYTGTTAIASYNLSTQWSSNQKFAFEVSVSAYPGLTVSIYLYDLNTSSPVSSSTISSTATTYTLIRSGSFTLVPGHSYAVQISGGNGVYPVYVSKAYLVALANN